MKGRNRLYTVVFQYFWRAIDDSMKQHDEQPDSRDLRSDALVVKGHSELRRCWAGFLWHASIDKNPVNI